MRKGLHALAPGDWLRQCYEINKQADRLATGSGSKRKGLALWGPSQSGKSTFLSHFIDRGHGDFASALQWEASPPFVFLAKDDETNALNPYNQQRDASGCITRFVLSDSPLSLSHPVEVVLATREQLVLSLALGYHSECKKHGVAVFWNGDSIRQLLETYRGTARFDRVSYEFLHDVTGAIGTLIQTEIPRYQNLKGEWPSLRSQILECPALLGSSDNARAFCSKVLWDGELDHRLMVLLDTLSKRLSALRSQPFVKIAATYDAAALLLDIDAAKKVNTDSSVSLAYGLHGDLLLIGGVEGTRFDRHALDFAGFQALVSELRIPLNRHTLEATAPEVVEALSLVDFIDFPGVSRHDTGGHLPDLDGMGDLQLYTQVLKRGKTASVFLSYAHNLAIDAVAILTRTNGGVYQPEQIISGVSAWVRSMGYPWPPRDSNPPLNIVMTFSARLVNEVADAVARNQRPQTLDGVFSWFDRLGPIADPVWARFWATSYPKFPRDGGRIDRTPEEVKAACDLLMSEAPFRARFGHRPEQLHEMAEASTDTSGDGGVLAFISSLSAQLAASDLEERRTILVNQLTSDLISLVKSAAPAEGGSSTIVKVEFENWKRSLERSMAADPDAAMPGAAAARGLMDLLTVDPSDLEPLPPNAAQKNIDNYVRDQLQERWLPRILKSGKMFAAAGIDSPSIATKRAKLLADFAGDFGGLARWIKSNLGDLTRPADCADARRYLAAHLSDLLLAGGTRPPHRTHEKNERGQSPIQEQLLAFAKEESRETGRADITKSPHYIGVIAPFFGNLDSIAAALGSRREPQAGDVELLAILEAMNTSQ